MNILAKTTLLALAGLTLASQAANALTYTPGDILLGFRTSTKDYVIDLGSYTQFTLANTNVLVANLNADLTSLAGSGWATSTGISWGAIGYANKGLTSGLIFASKGESTVGTTETAWDQKTKSNTNGEATNITAFTLNAYNGLSSNTANTTGIIQTPDSSTAPYWSNFVTGSYTGFSNISFGSFNPSIEANATGGYTLANTALDLFTISVSGQPGTGLNGTFTIEANGDLYFNAVPEPSTYAMMIGGVALLGLLRRRAMTA